MAQTKITNDADPISTLSDSESVQETRISKSQDSSYRKGGFSGNKKQQYIECPNNCGSVFYYKHTLNRHLDYVCGKAPRYKCPHCNHYCRQQWNLYKHVKERHPHRNVYAIDILRGKPIYPPELGSEPIHSKLANNENQESRIKIINVSSLVRPSHQALVSNTRNLVKRPIKRDNKPFPCTNKCGSSYKNIQSMRAHVEFECGQQPRFKCPYCDLRSKYSRNILSHVKILHVQQEIYGIDVVTKKTFGNIKKSSKKCKANSCLNN